VWENNLRLAILNFNILYFGLFFGILGIAYYLFYTCGKNPGFAEINQKDVVSIELEGDHLGYDNSIVVEEGRKSEGRESLLSGSESEAKASSGYSADNHDDQGIIVANSKSSRKDSDDEYPDKRFCDICNIIQPYRTRHCHQCERCIHKFDHHCFWIGTNILR